VSSGPSIDSDVLRRAQHYRTDMVALAPFGRTGHRSSRVVFGAAALGAMDQARADATIAEVIGAGVNHIDTAASYGDSEERLRPFLADHRGEVFLATKTGERTGEGARRELERSLQRMGVDSVDLVQLHNLVEPDEWEVAHGPGGALRALVRARDEGLVRWIGVTGHGLRIADMHLRSLDAFDYDSVLLPYSHLLMREPDYARDVERLRDRCVELGVAVQTIKAIARRRWEAGAAGPRHAWYEPLPEGPALERAIRWVLADERVFLNSTSDATRLRAVFAAADAAVGRSRPLDEELDADVAEHAMTPLFDGRDLERI
jgi:aryl-alcohol dehydrogenase-like predicted oxidoreductase